MQSVESAMVKAIGYDKEARTLRVEFRKGAVYEYENVTPETYTRLVSSESVGREMRQVAAVFKGRKVG